RDLELQRETRVKETESGSVVWDDVNEEEEHPFRYPHHLFFEPINHESLTDDETNLTTVVWDESDGEEGDNEGKDDEDVREDELKTSVIFDEILKFNTIAYGSITVARGDNSVVGGDDEPSLESQLIPAALADFRECMFDSRGLHGKKDKSNGGLNNIPSIPTVVTGQSWNASVLDSKTPVLVEFYASWCGPCQMVHRVIDEIAAEYAGKVKCYVLNADKDPRITEEYDIKAVPIVVLFKNGEKCESVVGTMPKEFYVAAIERVLSSSSSTSKGVL
ncbi:hypothetical protein M8C21_032041, partial [Ambrosia artemisiifolia]